MAENDYKELMEFLGKRFEGIDKQFEAVNKRLDNTAAKDDIEELKRHTGVLIEGVEHKLELLAEGITNVNEKLDRGNDVHEAEHAQLEKRILINTADIAKLDQRVARLEGNT